MQVIVDCFYQANYPNSVLESTFIDIRTQSKIFTAHIRFIYDALYLGYYFRLKIKLLCWSTSRDLAPNKGVGKGGVQRKA